MKVSKYDLRAPTDLFQQIESRVLAQPHLLSMDNYHELDGKEAVLTADINDDECAHCLFGWIVRLTPYAVQLEANHEDPMEVAQAILVSSGRMPIPRALAFSDEATTLKVIRGRADEERSLARVVEA